MLGALLSFTAAMPSNKQGGGGKWLGAVEDQQQPGGSGSPYARPAAGRRGGPAAAPRVLQEPVFQANKLSLTAARVGLSEETLSKLMLNCLRGYPNLLKLRLCKLMLANAAAEDGACRVAREHAANFQELADALEEAGVKDDPAHAGYFARSTMLLATLLGVAKLPAPQSEWVSDGAIVEGVVDGINLKQAEPTELTAVTMSNRPLDAQNVCRCWCGQPAAFRSRQAWGGSGKTTFLSCAKGACRFYIVREAVHPLQELMASLDIEHLPTLYCPKHPEKEIRVSTVMPRDGDGEPYLVAGCPWYSTAGGVREFCIRETLGSTDLADAHKITSAPMLKALDLLTGA